VSKRFHRISTPLYFNTVHLRSEAQLQALLVFALRPNPNLASHIRKIIIEGTWTEAAALFRLCGQFGALRFLDITLDASPPTEEFARQFFSQMGMSVNHVHVKIAGSSDSDAEDFCKHFHALTSVTHLTVRKQSNVYLTQPKTRLVLSQLARAIKAWQDLVRLRSIIFPFFKSLKMHFRNMLTLHFVSQTIQPALLEFSLFHRHRRRQQRQIPLP